MTTSLTTPAWATTTIEPDDGRHEGTIMVGPVAQPRRRHRRAGEDHVVIATIPLTDPLSLAWIAWCRAEHKPVTTIAARTRALRCIGNAGTATREEVEAWWLTRAHLGAATRHNDLAHLRSFYRWCKRWEYRDDDPTLRLDSPRVDAGLPRPMTREDLHLALDQLSRAPSGRPWNLSWGPDIRRAICLGAYAGLRISEAAALDWSDVDLENRQIRVIRSKGGKSRRIPMGPELLDALLPETGGNVVSGGAPYSTYRLARRVRSAFKALGIDATFHQLRHRYATIAYEASGDILTVSRLLGHANLNTTQIYVRTRDDVAEAIARAVSA
jgi:integrase